MEGISNETIVDFFENETDDDLKKKFVGVFLSNYVTRFISFHEMMIEKNRYPFIIMNMGQSNKNGTHWWSFFDLHPRKEIFYLTVLALRDLKNSSSTTIEKLLTKFYLESKN